MMKFVENPNLTVCTDIVIIGEKYCNILQNGRKVRHQYTLDA